MELINKLNIDWVKGIIVLCILVGAMIMTRVVRWLFKKSFETTSEKLKVDHTRYKFFKNTISFIIWLIALGAIVSLIPQLRSLAITLFAGAGIMMAIIGFAAQEAFSNIISGIFIVLFRPFRVGDLIKVGDLEYGIVEDITLRHTIIINFENKRIIIPNATVGSANIINDNIEDTKICRFIDVGISYDSDVDLATRILQEESEKHPLCIDPRTEEEKANNVPMVVVRLMAFGDFSIDLRANVWTQDPFAARQMHSDINRAVKKRFDAEGVEIPFPYRTLVYKNDLPPNSKPGEKT